jgi:hypothetical protein
MSFCQLFICITLTKRWNVVDDSTNDFDEWLRLSWIEKRMKNLLMFSFKSKLIIVKSYCVFYWIERFIVCWDVTSERILRKLDDVKSISCRRCVFVWRCFEMHERFIVLNCVEFLLFFCFNVALKTSRKMLVDAINTFFVFVECSAFERRMFACTKIAFFVVSTNLVDVIILLTSKALFDSAFLFKIFINSMRIIV